MGFSVYLPAGTMVANIEFNKAYSTEKVLHGIQRCVLYLHGIQRCVLYLHGMQRCVSLHVVTNLTNLFC